MSAKRKIVKMKREIIEKLYTVKSMPCRKAKKSGVS